MLTLSDITRQVARLVLPDMIATGSATAGATTSLTDTVYLTQPDAYFDKGTLWITSGTYDGQVLRVTGHRSNALTFSPTLAGAISAGNRYTVARAIYPYEQIKQAVMTALDDTYVEAEDATLTGDGTTLTFTLPTGVYDVKAVWIENPGNTSGNDNYKSSHWRERNGSLRFDYGYPPEDDWLIRVIYRARHADLVDYDDEVDGQIRQEWLRYAAARYLLDWGMGIYKAQAEYRIEERMNLVLEKLKELKPRNDAPDIRETTAGM